MDINHSCGFSVRTVNALQNQGIFTLEQAKTLGRFGLLRIPNMGKMGVKEVMDAIIAQDKAAAVQDATPEEAEFRDRVAMEVLKVIIGDMMANAAFAKEDGAEHRAAEQAYAYADAMLVARSRRP